MKTNNVIRKYIKDNWDFDPETSRIAAIEFARAPRTVVWVEIYHVAITHEYSTETKFEVVRVEVTGPRDGEQRVTNAGRVFMS